MPGRFPRDTWDISANDAHAYLGSILRMGRGIFVLQRSNQPDETIVLYEFEGCPYCRKVREVLTELDLNYRCRPCGKGSHNRRYVREHGGQEQFPYLVDPNQNESWYESEDIIDYLCNTYGEGRSVFSTVTGPINTAGAMLPTLIRPRGITVKDGCEDRNQPEQTIELYNFEASPFCRKVRERLCKLNLNYLVKNVGKGSPRRNELKQDGGKIQVPYLVDHNTNRNMYESDDIIDYLKSEYGR